MKIVFFLFFWMAVFLLAATAQARLGTRSGDEIQKVGIDASDSNHVVMFLSDGDVFESVNAGMEWKLVRQYNTPPYISFSQADGIFPVYRLLGGITVIRIGADGRMDDITPRDFLKNRAQAIIDAERKLYIEKYRAMMPRDNSWLLVFFSTGVGLVALTSFMLFRRKGKWGYSALQSVAIYVILGLAIFQFYSFIHRSMFYSQWYEWVVCLRDYPGLSLGVAFHSMGNSCIAPVTAFLLFPITPIFNDIMQTFTSVKLKIALASMPYLYIAFLLAALKYGRGFLSHVG